MGRNTRCACACCCFLSLVFLWLTYLARRGPISSPPPLSSPSARDRKRLLDRLSVIYQQMRIDGLQDAGWIELGLALRPEAVSLAPQLIIHTAHHPGHLLPAGTSILQVFDEAKQELLILGEPGSGKSKLLVALAQQLLEQARDDETAPLPVIVPLSSWAVKRGPLSLWLAEQVRMIYPPTGCATSRKPHTRKNVRMGIASFVRFLNDSLSENASVAFPSALCLFCLR